MFQIRHFYYRLWANKFSIRTFSSNWHNSSAIFGGQISQIHGFWNFKNQQFTQCHQFCTEISSPINDSTNSSSPISSVAEMLTSIEQNEQPAEIFDGANSTSSISSPETPTNIAKEQNEQHEIPSIAINQDKIYQSYHQLVNSDRKILKIKLQKDKNGQKQNFFKIVIRAPKFRRALNISFPEDGYAFVQNIDELIEELTMENVDQKFTLPAIDNGLQPKSVIVRTVEKIGKHQKFQLELLFFPNEDKKDDGQKQLFFVHVLTIKLAAKNEIYSVLFPLEAMIWLREQMVDMLRRHDGTETIEREPPAKIPKQFLTDGIELIELKQK